DDRGIAGDVPAEVPRRDPRLKVVAAARAGADHDGELLAGVEVLGGGGGGAGPRHDPKRKRCTAIPNHGRPPADHYRAFLPARHAIARRTSHATLLACR